MDQVGLKALVGCVVGRQSTLLAAGCCKSVADVFSLKFLPWPVQMPAFSNPLPSPRDGPEISHDAIFVRHEPIMHRDRGIAMARHDLHPISGLHLPGLHMQR